MHRIIKLRRRGGGGGVESRNSVTDGLQRATIVKHSALNDPQAQWVSVDKGECGRAHMPDRGTGSTRTWSR